MKTLIAILILAGTAAGQNPDLMAKPTAWDTRVNYIVDLHDYRTQPITWGELEAYLAAVDTTWDSVKVYRSYKDGKHEPIFDIFEWPGEYHYKWIDDWEYCGKRWSWKTQGKPKTLPGLMLWKKNQ